MALRTAPGAFDLWVRADYGAAAIRRLLRPLL
jgi:hypothetical protein